MRSSLEILLRSHGDFKWGSWEDLPTISREDLPIKRFYEETLLRSFEENECRSIKDILKIFRRKNLNQKWSYNLFFYKSSEENSEELPKNEISWRSSWDLIIHEI